MHTSRRLKHYLTSFFVFAREVPDRTFCILGCQVGIGFGYGVGIGTRWDKPSLEGWEQGPTKI